MRSLSKVKEMVDRSRPEQKKERGSRCPKPTHDLEKYTLWALSNDM
jgi:hypothetical protein